MIGFNRIISQKSNSFIHNHRHQKCYSKRQKQKHNNHFWLNQHLYYFISYLQIFQTISEIQNNQTEAKSQQLTNNNGNHLVILIQYNPNFRLKQTETMVDRWLHQQRKSPFFSWKKKKYPKIMRFKINNQ